MRNSSAPSFVRLNAQVGKVELRNESYQGRDHLVIPIVALVGNIVVEGMLSDGPEFIPAHVLAAAPQSLNGRPLVNIHPSNGEGSANTPTSWEHESFGQVWNSEFSDNRLRCEIWVDREKAEQVGEGAVEVVTRAEAGEMFEVSVGAWVWLEAKDGKAPNGDEYEYEWQACIYDHLAAGLQAQGGRGACDVKKHGCGGPRYFTAKQATAIRDKELLNMNLLTALVKRADLAALAADLGMSTNELATKLSKALRASVPGFMGVMAIYPDSGTLIYIAMPKDEYEYYRCKYDATGDEATTSLHKRVEPSITYKPVANADATGDESENEDASKAQLATTSCPCRNHASNEAKELLMSKKINELAGKLIACTAAPFTDADKAKLEAMNEPQLEALVKAFAEPSQPSPTPPAPPSEPAPNPPSQPPSQPGPETVTLTKEQHDHLTRLAVREANREKKHRSQLITALAADESVKAVYGGEKELAEKATDELEKLAQFAGVLDGDGDSAVDMRAQAGVLVPSGSEPEYQPLNSWGVKGALATSLGIKQPSS